jgi:hypothetical protein
MTTLERQTGQEETSRRNWFSEGKMMRGADDELHAPLEGALRPLLILGAKHPEEV